ncbi:MAG: hypothetical protein V3S67_02590, partial [Gammaproteobacteria bacterium]
MTASGRFLPVAILSPDRLVIGESGHWDASSKSHIRDIHERLLSAAVSSGRCNTLPWTGEVIAMKKKYKRVGFTAAQSAELWDR